MHDQLEKEPFRHLRLTQKSTNKFKARSEQQVWQKVKFNLSRGTTVGTYESTNAICSRKAHS